MPKTREKETPQPEEVTRRDLLGLLRRSFRVGDESSSSGEVRVNRRVALKAGAAALALGGCGKDEHQEPTQIEGAPTAREKATIRYPSEFALPQKRSFEDIRSHYPSFNDLMSEAVSDGLPEGVGLAEALLYLGKDSVSHGLTEDFEFATYQDKIYSIAGDMGKALMQEKPTDPREIVGTLNSAFFKRLHPIDRHDREGETATINEVLDMGGGYCEDLLGIYVSCVEILGRAGIDLPIRPVPAPDHILAAWDDRENKNQPPKKGETRFFIELTANGKIFDKPDFYERALDWDPKRSKGYFRTGTYETALASELGNRSIAFSSLLKREYDVSLQDARWAAKLCPTADAYGDLGIAYEKTGDEGHLDKAIEAFTTSLELDPTGRRVYVSRAGAYEKKYRKTGDVEDLKNALRDYNTALSNKLTVGDRQATSFLGTLPCRDESIISFRSKTYMQLYDATGEMGYLDESIKDHLRVFEYGQAAKAYEKRYESTGSEADLVNALFSWEMYANNSRQDKHTLEEAYSNRGRLYIERYRITGDDVNLARAVTEYTKAIDTGYTFKENTNLYGRGLTHYLAGDMEHARVDLSDVITETDEHSWDHVNALIIRGMSYEDEGKGDKDQATADFRRAAKIYRRYIPSETVQELREKSSQLPAGHFLKQTTEALEILQENPKATKLFQQQLTH